ncbi:MULTISPECIES: cytochrome P450 [unclassified Modestobacter]|uniref:cytochrome P450 n=1 Tax=unclassified Modestobacter TaxID=2643866 RepID=UPI0022AA4D1E|nr:MULTISPECIES: cytochrome P450 [unclassified Modestobacter]MCZ2826232.1 cytochrome P450 [Modestobacter sp. VKM Ac-2981]MCZ2852703.1 cytochrome P450 [Modestobacter sp. VKM Ac-2982]
MTQPQDTAALLDPATYETGPPLAELARLRAAGPVTWVDEPDGPGCWLVLRHAEVERVLKDPATFSSWLGATQVRDAGDLPWVRQMMLNQDPPDHSRLRRLLTRSFTPRAVAALTASIEATAAGLVDRMIAGAGEGRCDFAKDVAADLPLVTLADVLGVPAEDRWLMFDWSNRVIGWQDPDYASSAAFDASRGTDLARQAVALRPLPDAEGRLPDPRTRAGMPDLYAYARLLAEEKRRAPGRDVMSILLAQTDGDDAPVSDAEFENMFWLFAVAGNETLRNGLPGGLIALLSHPEELARLRADPGLLPGAVEEMLRWWTPVMVFRRTATRDVTIGDARVRAGDKVVVSFTSANRDERVFPEPDRFDVRRAPNPQLSFGHGPHFCLGAQLARVQMRSLFAELLRRTSVLQLDGPPALLRSSFQRGVKRLPIRWVAG